MRLAGWEPGVPTTLLLRYGALADPPENRPTDVWAGTFLGVWHMSPELTGVDDELVRDATANAEHGVTRGAIGADQVVPGIVGNALMFDGDDDAVEVPATFRGNLNAFTISGWVRDDSDGTIHGPFFSRFNGDNLYPRCRKVADSGGILCQTQVEGAAALATASGPSNRLPHETWGLPRDHLRPGGGDAHVVPRRRVPR